MQVGYPKLELPRDIASMVREVTMGMPSSPIPLGWEGIIVYHPATDQYYSTKSNDPINYEKIIRERVEPRWSNIALSLQKLLNVSNQYQFFVTSVRLRTEVENWLASVGKRRVSTMMGDAADEQHVMFKITSNFNKVSRYVVAPRSTPAEKLIAAANISMANWLSSSASKMRNERKTMKVALRSVSTVNRRVFEPESTVVIDNNLAQVSHNLFRATSMRANEADIERFIRGTVEGR